MKGPATTREDVEMIPLTETSEALTSRESRTEHVSSTKPRNKLKSKIRTMQFHAPSARIIRFKPKSEISLSPRKENLKFLGSDSQRKAGLAGRMSVS